MQFKPITAIIVLSLVIVSLLVSGCTSNTSPTTSPTSSPTTYTASSPTPIASSDYASYFDRLYSGGTAMIKQPFTKGMNDRGNAVFKAVTKNSSATGNYQYAVVIELTQSQSAAKQLYDKTVAQKLSEGFTARPNDAASWKASFPEYKEVWVGSSNGDLFYVMYSNNPNVSPSWLVTTEAGGAG